VAVVFFGVPFRGSVGALLLVSAAFLADMLLLGLLISTVTRNRFPDRPVSRPRSRPATRPTTP
jgi:hypothetical protein